MVLVDSTVWIDLLRRQQTVAVRALERLIDLGEAAVAPVIVQEILQGAVDKSALERLARRFLALPMVGIGDPVALHVAAARLYARARWQGVTPRSPHDCLVAATALQADLPLLHDDRDFEALAGVEPRLRVVPLG